MQLPRRTFPSGTVTRELMFPTSRFGTPLFDEHRTDRLTVFRVHRVEHPERSLAVGAHAPRRPACAALGELAARDRGISIRRRMRSSRGGSTRDAL